VDVVRNGQSEMTGIKAPKEQRSGRRLIGVPIVVALFFFAMLFPTSVSVSMGSIRLSLFRVVLIVMCAFRELWALISRDLGHAFRAIVGSHFADAGRLADGFMESGLIGSVKRFRDVGPASQAFS